MSNALRNKTLETAIKHLESLGFDEVPISRRERLAQQYSETQKTVQACRDQDTDGQSPPWVQPYRLPVLEVNPLLIGNLPYEAVIPERMQWTASSLKLFRKCKRKFFWKYILRLRHRSRSSSLVIGHSFHSALARWYRSRRAAMSAISQDIKGSLIKEVMDNGAYYDQDDLDKLSKGAETFVGMTTAYADLYESDRTDWVVKPEGIEMQFKVGCGDFDYTGQIDLLAARREKNTKRLINFISEHKTCSKIALNESYIDRLVLDTQNRGYVFGATHDPKIAVKIDEVLYDVTRKSLLRKKSGESIDQLNERIKGDYLARPSNYFYREQLRFDNTAINQFEYELHQTHKEFKAIIDGEFGDPKNPRSWLPNDTICSEYFKTCEYFDLCVNGLDQGKATRYVQGDSMHQELAVEPEGD